MADENQLDPKVIAQTLQAIDAIDKASTALFEKHGVAVLAFVGYHKETGKHIQITGQPSVCNHLDVPHPMWRVECAKMIKKMLNIRDDYPI